MVRTTKAQRKAIFKLFQRDFPSWVTPRRRLPLPPCPRCGHGSDAPHVATSSLPYRRFRATVQEGYGCLRIEWKGMWLGIEPDGYTHS